MKQQNGFAICRSGGPNVAIGHAQVLPLDLQWKEFDAVCAFRRLLRPESGGQAQHANQPSVKSHGAGIIHPTKTVRCTGPAFFRYTRVNCGSASK